MVTMVVGTTLVRGEGDGSVVEGLGGLHVHCFIGKAVQRVELMRLGHGQQRERVGKSESGCGVAFVWTGAGEG